MTNKPTPTVGMIVTWIRPQDDLPNKLFIEVELVQNIGLEGLTVRSIKTSSPDITIVTLNRWGKPVRRQWNSDRVPKPDGYVGEIMEFSWHWLRPFKPIYGDP